jgi:DNA sulfur modification protein DndD
MRIHSITLHNYKSFEGTCRIDGLTENLEPGKNIILFGGLNGAGKTSIFEAMLLCLYGKNNKTLFPSRGAKREDYLSYVAAVTNKAAKKRMIRADMWIEIVFDQVEFGNTTHTLSVKRKWYVRSHDESAEEVGFEITQDGKQIEYVHQEEFEQFIRNELIPYEVTQFFFFDGEKIQDFIKDEDSSFEESLEAVLGISLYRTLSNDIQRVRQQLLSDYNRDKVVQSELVSVAADKARAELRLEECKQNIHLLEEEIDEIEIRIEQIDKETFRISRVSAESREEAETEKYKLQAEKELLEERIFEAIQDNFPFVVMHELAQELVEQLDVEQQIARSEAARQEAESKISVISQRVFEESGCEPPLTSQQKDFYSQRLRVILHDVFGGASDHQVVTLHNLSPHDVEQIKQRIRNNDTLLGGLASSLERLQEVEPRLRQIQRAEQRAVDEETRDLYVQRGQLNEQVNTKRREIETLQAEISRIEDELVSLKRRQTELEEKAGRNAKVSNQVEYCQKLRATLEEFSHRLRARKVELLQQYTLEMWTLLARKQDQIHKIVIRPDNNFSIDLYDADELVIDKTKLSAGEKELLAISLIWGLTRLANRSLPIVIDTPLGRLDSEHRAHIAQQYFPRASHQVILLSTDTEIVGHEYNAVRPFISRHYLIEKNSDQETSRVTEGYFTLNGN